MTTPTQPRTLLELRDSIPDAEARFRLDELLEASGLDVEDSVAVLRSAAARSALVWLATQTDHDARGIGQLLGIVRLNYVARITGDAMTAAFDELAMCFPADDAGAPTWTHPTVPPPWVLGGEG